MGFPDFFYLDIQKIHIAHQYVLNQVNRCAYPNGRGQYGLVYVLNGEAEYRFYSGPRVKMTKGNLLFLFPDSAYSITVTKNFEHYTVNFDLCEETSYFDALRFPYCLLKSGNTESLARLFRNLVEIWAQKKAGAGMLATSVLYELLYNFYSHYTKEQNSAAYHRLLPAREYIEQHYKEPITLEVLAFLCNMSLAHFRREWRRIWGESPLQYRDSIRLYYAKEYLKCGYYTIAEISEKCGFGDASYFSRFFKKKTGITPGTAKKKFLEE